MLLDRLTRGIAAGVQDHFFPSHDDFAIDGYEQLDEDSDSNSFADPQGDEGYATADEGGSEHEAPLFSLDQQRGPVAAGGSSSAPQGTRGDLPSTIPFHLLFTCSLLLEDMVDVFPVQVNHVGSLCSGYPCSGQ